MNIVLPYCHKDRQAAIRLLRWMAELDGAQTRHELHLVASNPCTDAENAEAIEAGKLAFSNVVLHHQLTPDESGWPKSCTTLFRLTCQVMKQCGTHWLWCEPDCTPVCPGWLDELDAEYKAKARPFMGAWHNQPVPHISGNAIYPADPARFNPLLFSRPEAPWDLVNPGATLAQAWLTDKIQHTWSPSGHDIKSPPWHFDSPYDIDKILKPATVLFHRCKDGSMIEMLRTRRNGRHKTVIEQIRRAFSNPDITVVITNFSRPDKVRHTFESCLRANIKNVVVAASGCDAELARVHASFKKQKPDVIIDAIESDRGCNEMWLRGVSHVKTKWTHLLHDDDLIMPEFETLNEKIKSGADFYHWNGTKHAYPPSLLDGQPMDYVTLPNVTAGKHPTSILWPVLLGNEHYSLSPVGALFPTEHVIKTLEEAERTMQSSRFFSGPKMMVGNDLLLWLAAVERYPIFEYIPRPLVSYGHWEGSTTYDDVVQKRGVLSSIYDAVRESFLQGPDFDMLECPRLVHIQSNFIRADEAARVAHAKHLWSNQYLKGNWVLCGIEDTSLPRLFLDGERELPYLRDMIDMAVSKHRSESPIFVLTNTDTLPVPSLTRHLVDTFKKYACAYSFRRDINGIHLLDETTIRTQTQGYAGTDLFAFTASWWDQYRTVLPDLLYGSITWDYCLHNLMDASKGKRFCYLIWHTLHLDEAAHHRGSRAHEYNCTVAAPFLRSLGIEPYWISKKPVPNPR